MTTPNQPVPPPGYRLLTPEEYGKPLPEDSIFLNLAGDWRPSKCIGSVPHVPDSYSVPVMTQIDDSDIDLGQVESKLGDLECERNAARIELATLRAQNAEQAKRIEALEATLTGAYGETKHLRSQNAEQKRLIDCANNYIPDILKSAVSVEELTAQLATANAALAATAEILRNAGKKESYCGKDAGELLSVIFAALCATERGKA